MGLIKTLDGKDVNFQTYKQACMELCNGLLTKEQIDDVMGLVQVHKKCIALAIDTIRRLAIKTQTSDEEMCTTWRQYEKDMGIEAYKKTDNCLDRQEHLDIIQVLLEESEPLTQGIALTTMSGSEESALERQYLANRKFTDKGKLYK